MWIRVDVIPWHFRLQQELTKIQPMLQAQHMEEVLVEKQWNDLLLAVNKTFERLSKVKYVI